MITVLFPSDYFDQNKPDVGFIKEYRAAAENQIHVLLFSYPEIYPELTEDTAPMIVFEDPEKIDYEQVRKAFGKCMVKDF